MGLQPGPRSDIRSTPDPASGFTSYGERRSPSLLNMRRDDSASLQRTSGVGSGCVPPLRLAVCALSACEGSGLCVRLRIRSPSQSFNLDSRAEPPCRYWYRRPEPRAGLASLRVPGGHH
ncbi:hypothetical protein PAL_GLEAN10008186 [Pteropus alecto]|uniref:Uncharacterized protein n=1 Tax=Pteropus alecto TaxID=9402 RepID=L5K0K2_PTEAL|nr:hypothetical protein PAL_GLEAN10008186 [Pteropus alecto]